jgi:hypothetical protein
MFLESNREYKEISMKQINSRLSRIAALIAAACQQYRICGSGNCPVGIATQNPELRKRLHVEASAKRVGNFLHVSTEELKMFARITGHDDVHDLCIEDLVTLDRDIAKYTDIPHAGKAR